MVLEPRAIWIIATGVIRQHGMHASTIAKSRAAGALAEGDVAHYQEWRAIHYATETLLKANPTLLNAQDQVGSTPLQHAGVMALSQPDEFYKRLSEEYRGRRDHLILSLESAGFRCFIPKGAYYVMTDISKFGFADDMEFVMHMIRDAGVAAVPGSSFFNDSRDGANMIRFCFCKKYATLEEAGHRLTRL